MEAKNLMMKTINSSRNTLKVEQFSVQIYLAWRKMRVMEEARTMSDPTMLNFLLFILLIVK